MGKNRSKKFLKLLVVYLVGAGLLYYWGITSSAPQRKLKHLEKDTYTDSLFTKKHSLSVTDSGLFELEKKQAFLESQQALSRIDSFGLIINLKDSTVSLGLKGVSIHTSKVQILKKDCFFNVINPIVQLKMFNGPLDVISEKTSIVKEPIVVQKAPKDTVEAMSMVFMPDTLIQNPAYLILGMEHGINIIMLQEKWLTKTEKKVKNKYFRIRNRLRFSDYFKNVFHPFKPQYSPTIVISMNVNDIRSIYRALPAKAQVVIGF